MSYMKAEIDKLDYLDGLAEGELDGAEKERERIRKLLLKAYPPIETWPCWNEV